jgi:hypothetical protein
MAGYNLPDDCSAGTYGAPWNQPEDNELPEDIQEVIDSIDRINMWIYHSGLKVGDRRFSPEYDVLDSFREVLLKENS